jgi:hypothetical protein
MLANENEMLQAREKSAASNVKGDAKRPMNVRNAESWTCGLTAAERVPR